MNVKNEDKVGKDLASIPSLKAFDAKNGLTGTAEEEKQAKKALAQQETKLMDSYEVNFDELARNIPARSESEYDGEYVQLKLQEYVKQIEGPDDLETLTLGDDNLS